MGIPLKAPGHGALLRESFGPFVLLRRIAVGGSAEVFLARPKLGMRPAPMLVIKRHLERPQDGRGFTSLSREADLHQCVRHESVVQVYGAGMVGDVPYIAMEYVPGVDLHRVIKRVRAENRSIPASLAVYVTRRLALALVEVHRAVNARGVPLRLVHGDVTPSNVYLSPEGDVKLGDFGIARSLEASSGGQSSPPSERSSVPGKFGYIAPEQLNGESYDHRADLFALAILLGELVSGGPVFEGKGKLALLLSVRDANITPLRAASRSFPPGLFQVLERALQRDPAARYQSAEDFAEALEPFCKRDDTRVRKDLGEIVAWAADTQALAARLEANVSNSMRIRITPASGTRRIGEEIHPGTPSSVRRGDQIVFDGLRLSKLIELITTGSLLPNDEVAFMGQPFTRLSEIHELAPHLLPSTSATTGRMYEPGTPDYVAHLEHVSPLVVLARMRQGRETGALFASRVDSHGLGHRRDIYIVDGRLHHVEASSASDRLGQYLLRRRMITAAQLERALAEKASYGGRLGDSLIGLQMVEPVDIYRAIRNLGRDRVAALCCWDTGDIQFYRGGAAGEVPFPLDLDLSVVMMAGILMGARGAPKLPPTATALVPGPSAPSPSDSAEIGTAPASLQLVPGLARVRVTAEVAIREITAHVPERVGQITTEGEAVAALLTAEALGWIHLRS